MRKRFYRVLIALSMTAVLFGASACGNNTSDSETFPTETESTEEPETESEEEIEFEFKEEVETEVEIGKVEDGEYKIYPAFVTTFELEDNVLKIGTENRFDDFPIPEDMEINFEYPLSDDFQWSDSTSVGEDDVDWYEWFSFYWEGITMSVDRYLDGQYGDYYTSGEDFCEKNAVWTIIIKDEKVQSISMDLANADTEKSETAQEGEASAETIQENKASTETTNSAKVDGTKETNTSASSNPTASIPTSKPVYQHTWVERYGTIEHEAQGEWQQVQIGTSDEVWICNSCGAQFGSDAELEAHAKSFVGVDNGHARATYTIRGGQPIYESQFVVIQEAWTENAVIGFECTTCGATK